MGGTEVPSLSSPRLTEGFHGTGLLSQGGELLCLLIPETIHHPFLGISPSLMPVGRSPRGSKRAEISICVAAARRHPSRARHPASALTRSSWSNSQIQRDFASRIPSCLPCPRYQRILWQKHVQVSSPCSAQAWSERWELATSKPRVRKELN